LRIIPQSAVERLLPVAKCVDVMRKAMIATSNRDVTLPIRQFMPVPNAPGKLALMPGALGDPACFGIKLVCKYERPHGDPLGTHVGMVLLFDSVKGVPLAMVEGASLTAIRTSAASVLATDLLAREDATRLAIIGNGEQAARHVDAMLAVRPISRIDIWGRDAERARAFADEIAARTGLLIDVHTDIAEAVAQADIVCTTTAAQKPILFGKDLKDGQHINLVGAAVPTSAEADSAAVKRSRYFVDYRPASLVKSILSPRLAKSPLAQLQVVKIPIR
jgi:ornithine cyclodeaminase/alanine dehydrogenase-like protein (mu-crystallin family)